MASHELISSSPSVRVQPAQLGLTHLLDKLFLGDLGSAAPTATLVVGVHHLAYVALLDLGLNAPPFLAIRVHDVRAAA